MSIVSGAESRAARAAELRAANQARRERLATARANPPVRGGSAGAGAGGGAVPRIYRASDGREFESESALLAYEDTLAQKQSRINSAFAILPAEFRRYGFDDPEFFNQLEGLIRRDLSDAEVRLEIRKLPAYTRRFGAIKRRIDKGLSAISEAEYLALEDQYANTMRRFGLPESYYAKQVGRTNPTFDSLIEFDVSPVELEDRLMIGQNRLNNAPPEVMRLMSDYYSDVISRGDALAYLLDPKNALEQIRRKVTAAEIGAGAAQSGLRTERERAEELQRFGVTGEAARQGFQTIAGGLTRGSQLAAIYQEEPYGQETAETEVFGLAGAAQAGRQRRRLAQQERAAFGGTTGISGGALARDRAGSI